MLSGKSMYIPDRFFATLHASLVLTFTYCYHKSIIL